MIATFALSGSLLCSGGLNALCATLFFHLFRHTLNAKRPKQKTLRDKLKNTEGQNEKHLGTKQKTLRLKKQNTEGQTLFKIKQHPATSVTLDDRPFMNYRYIPTNIRYIPTKILKTD